MASAGVVADRLDGGLRRGTFPLSMPSSLPFQLLFSEHLNVFREARRGGPPSLVPRPWDKRSRKQVLEFHFDLFDPLRWAIG
jgi:hypothetical protein